jgi:hypothetical protein
VLAVNRGGGDCGTWSSPRRGALLGVDDCEDEDGDFVSDLIRPKRYLGWFCAGLGRVLGCCWAWCWAQQLGCCGQVSLVRFFLPFPFYFYFLFSFSILHFVLIQI